MAILHLRSACEIRAALPTSPADAPFRFTVSGAPEADAVSVTLMADGGSLLAHWPHEVSPSLGATFRTPTAVSAWPAAVRQEFIELFGPLSEALYRVFGLITQELQKYEGHVLCNATNAWSEDGSTWQPTNATEFEVVDWSHSVYRVDRKHRNHIQRLLARGESPLAAYEHLHEAWRSREVRFGWIEATIAAELGIKEVLGRLEPKLLPLLLEVPAPPLSKLYGAVLEAVAGERSPFVGALQKGAEIRNKLVHRPDSIPPTGQELRDYVRVVGEALEHLLVLDRSRDTLPGPEA